MGGIVARVPTLVLHPLDIEKPFYLSHDKPLWFQTYLHATSSEKKLQVQEKKKREEKNWTLSKSGFSSNKNEKVDGEATLYLKCFLGEHENLNSHPR